MLCVVLIIFFVLSLLFVRYGIKDRLSRFLILGHLCYWFICLIISTFNPFGLYEVSPDTYYIFILHTLSFLLGFILIKPGGFCKNLFEISDNVTETIDRLHRSKLWFCFCVCYLLLIIVIFYKYKEILLLYTVSDVARDVDLIFEGQGILSPIYKFIIPAINNVLVFLSIYCLLYKRDWKFILVYLLPVVLKSAIGGSRGGIMMIAVYAVILFLYRFIFIKSNTRTYKRMLFLCTVSLIAVYIIAAQLSYLRNIQYGGTETTLSIETLSEGARDLNRDMIVYCIGPFRAFDYAIENNYVSQSGGYKWGRATFMGLEGFLSMFTSQLGYEIETVYSSTVQVQQSNHITIGYSSKDDFTTFNYAYTNAMIFYYDMGIFGVFLFSLLYGLIIRLSIRRLYSKRSIWSLMLVTYFFYSILRVGFNWIFVAPASWVFMFMLLFLDLPIKIRGIRKVQ